MPFLLKSPLITRGAITSLVIINYRVGFVARKNIGFQDFFCNSSPALRQHKILVSLVNCYF